MRPYHKGGQSITVQVTMRPYYMGGQSIDV